MQSSRLGWERWDGGSQLPNDNKMLPFDDIQSSPELGLEDDVLPAQQRFPTPKWLRGSSSSPQSSKPLSRHISTTARTIYHAARTSLLPSLAEAVTRAISISAPLLRPRLTIRYILFSAVLIYAAYRIFTSRPLLASPLPPYAGAPYDVGAIDVEFALPGGPRRDISNVTFRADGRPAFEVETVLLTLYYPTARDVPLSPSSPDVMYWIPKPISATAKGYARFLGVDNFVVRGALTFGLWLIAGGITIPARVGAPLTPPGPSAEKLPVLVFSHGMLSSRTDYTSYLGSLASCGVIVAAIEHRDGSSPGSAVRQRRDVDGTLREEWRYAFGLRDLVTPDDFDTPALKEVQLSFREAEIDAAAYILRALDEGSLHARDNTRHPVSASPELFASFAGRLEVTPRDGGVGGMTLAGHSYGATGVLRALRSDRQPKRQSTLPREIFSGAVALDPGKSSGPLNADIAVPLVVCHSASWSKAGPTLFYGRPHFEVVRDLVEGVNERCGNKTDAAEITRGDDENSLSSSAEHTCAPRSRGWFLTSLGTTHPSITDAPLLEPLLLSWTTGSTMDANQGIQQYVHLTRDFVSYQHAGSREGLLGLSGGVDGQKGDDQGDGVVYRKYDPSHNEGMPEKWRPFWQIHVAPE